MIFSGLNNFKILILSGWTLALTWAQYKLWCRMQEIKFYTQPVDLSPQMALEIATDGTKIGHVILVGDQNTAKVWQLIMNTDKK